MNNLVLGSHFRFVLALGGVTFFSYKAAVVRNDSVLLAVVVLLALAVLERLDLRLLRKTIEDLEAARQLMTYTDCEPLRHAREHIAHFALLASEEVIDIQHCASSDGVRAELEARTARFKDTQRRYWHAARLLEEVKGIKIKQPVSFKSDAEAYRERDGA